MCITLTHATFSFPQIDEHHKEYAMGVTTLADSFGITVAGLIAIPIHNIICSLPIKT